MKSVVIAPVGDNPDALFVGLKEFPTEKVVLLAPEGRLGDAEKAKRDLEKFSISADIIQITGNIMEEVFKVFSEVKKNEAEREVVVNIATGDKVFSSLCLSAAFVNGLKAFDVLNNEVRLLPVMNYSYYRVLTDRKIDVMKVLHEKGSLSLELIGTATGMSLPLLSYHLNGTYKVEGLKELGLIETISHKGKLEVKLSPLGALLVKGYV